jgi:hypothetical protein
MASGDSTIRFKRGDVEFELTGSQADVAKAWAAIEESVVASFAAPTTLRRPAGSNGGSRSERRKSTTRKRSAPAGERSTSDVRKRLLDAKLDSFPEIGKNPPAVYVGYAVLRWAREELEIGELTVPDIHAVAHKLRIGYSENAYREAFRPHARAVNKTSKSPQTYELMNPGDDALDTYLEQVAAGGSPTEAEAKAEEAEAKAKA